MLLRWPFFLFVIGRNSFKTYLKYWVIVINVKVSKCFKKRIIDKNDVKFEWNIIVKEGKRMT